MATSLATRVARRALGSTATLPPIRIAFLGAGDISRLHFEGIRSTPGAELAGVWSLPGCSVVTDPEAVARAYGSKLYATPEALVDDPEVDAVFVLTNMESHCDLAVMAMERGKHVLVEKPMASSVAELERMRDAAAHNGVALMPGHNYIYEPWFHRTRRLIQSGSLGEISTLHVMYNIHHPDAIFARDSIQGVVRQIGTHLAYMTVFLAGQPLEVSAFKSTVGTAVGEGRKENIFVANMRMESGALAHLEASFAADDHGSDPWSVYLKVLGTKGSARYSYNDWVVNAPHPAGAHSHTYVPYPETVRDEARFFVEEVVGRGTAPLSTVEDAIVCQKVIEGIETSAAEARHVKLR